MLSSIPGFYIEHKALGRFNQIGEQTVIGRTVGIDKGPQLIPFLCAANKAGEKGCLEAAFTARDGEAPDKRDIPLKAVKDF